jgi:hypothetical protein
MMGVSGGGGDPRCARVVEVEAVELRRLMPPGFGIFSAGSEACGAACGAVLGGGKNCWWYAANWSCSAPAGRNGVF